VCKFDDCSQHTTSLRTATVGHFISERPAAVFPCDRRTESLALWPHAQGTYKLCKCTRAVGYLRHMRVAERSTRPKPCAWKQYFQGKVGRILCKRYRLIGMTGEKPPAQASYWHAPATHGIQLLFCSTTIDTSSPGTERLEPCRWDSVLGGLPSGNFL